MISEGQIVLFRFPRTDHEAGKLRPALVLKRLPGKYDDWLICMISSRTHQYIQNFDERMNPDDKDFLQSGLKLPRVIRVSRLAVVESHILLGKLGKIDNSRLVRVKINLCEWIASA